MFECTVQEDGDGVIGPVTYLGLNEVTIQTGPPFSMIELGVMIDGEMATRYAGDGLIISTPIGSTAHSLSAGGPILGQELDAFVVTPICPHTLNTRPLVDSASKVFEITIGRASAGTTLVIDGQVTLPVGVHHRITIRRAPVQFQLVKVPGHSYYRTLRDKLSWGMTANYRRE
jgi:NAD+ kinase